MLGFAEGEIEPTYPGFLQLLYPDDRTILEDALAQHFQHGKLYRLEIRRRHKNGTYRWFETSGKAALDAEGRPRRMCGTTMDITDKKRLQKELEEREYLLQEVGTMTHSGGWEVDLSTGRSYWSKQVYDICQMPYDYQPTLADALSFYTSESKVLLSRLVEAAITRGEPWDEELQMITGQVEFVFGSQPDHFP
ncbi:MAG: PAS domain-containing protein [Cytophagales bacterium]|nr:PAS domain-containing protein [Cytophagales bacterium]